MYERHLTGFAGMEGGRMGELQFRISTGDAPTALNGRNMDSLVSLATIKPLSFLAAPSFVSPDPTIAQLERLGLARLDSSECRV